MRLERSVLQLLVLATIAAVEPSGGVAQIPPAGAPPSRGAAPAGQRGGGRGRGVQVMTLTSSGLTDGGVIPVKYSQAGDEVSPPLAWTSTPDGTVSFTLVVHDANAASGSGLDDVLHWLVWNIPGSATSLAEAVPQGPQLPDGTRQISVTGPYYRGPAAPATGPAHHYLFELYALDTLLSVPPVGASPATTRVAVMTAMTGHVRGKAVLVGLFRRSSP